MRKPWIGLALCLVLPAMALARDNLASRPVNLPVLELREDLTFSQSEYHVETGKAYRLVIKSDGGEPYSFRAPDLFQQIWINGVQMDGVTIKTAAITALDFDDATEVTILFVPIRPGKFAFWVEGYQTRGMAGDFVVE
jgi:uncharacterized cupredoxin-like copper-binding protein